MDRRLIARAVLAADAAGCVGAGIAVLATPRLGARAQPISTVRVPLSVCLAITGAALVSCVREPNEAALNRAARVNVAWAVGCAASLILDRSHTPLTRALVATTGLLDASIAVLQRSLRPHAHGAARLFGWNAETTLRRTH